MRKIRIEPKQEQTQKQTISQPLNPKEELLYRSFPQILLNKHAQHMLSASEASAMDIYPSSCTVQMVQHLPDEDRSESEIEIDFDKIARVGQKVNELLVKRTKSSAEAYAVLRFLCVYYEQDLCIVFQPEFEEALKNMVKKTLDGSSEPTKRE
jgi:hypothetical protein